MKECRQCWKVKDDFYPDKRQEDGLQTVCVACRRLNRVNPSLALMARRTANREKKRRAYYAEVCPAE